MRKREERAGEKEPGGEGAEAARTPAGTRPRGVITEIFDEAIKEAIPEPGQPEEQRSGESGRG